METWNRYEIYHKQEIPKDLASIEYTAEDEINFQFLICMTGWVTKWSLRQRILDENHV